MPILGLVLLVPLIASACAGSEPALAPRPSQLRSHQFDCGDFSRVSFRYTDAGADLSVDAAQFVWHTYNYVWPGAPISVKASAVSAVRLFEHPLIKLANGHWLSPAEIEWDRVDLSHKNVHRMLGLELHLNEEAAATLHEALLVVHKEQVADLLRARQVGTLIGGVVIGESGSRRSPPEKPSTVWRVGLAEVDFDQGVREIEALLGCAREQAGRPTSR